MNTPSAPSASAPSSNAVLLSGQQVRPFQLDANQGSISFSALNSSSLYGSAAGATALRADGVHDITGRA